MNGPDVALVTVGVLFILAVLGIFALAVVNRRKR